LHDATGADEVPLVLGAAKAGLATKLLAAMHSTDRPIMRALRR